ncbi:MAG: DUF2267 domain-containing protein [Proteobacteria bacterium]|nr:DUF2267 domain-containing protein [Pseudomonadota bacterium]
MSTLENTLEKSYIWLNFLQAQLNLNRTEDAYRLLKVVLHELRDRLPVTEAAHLGAQLPMLIRGLYYEGFRPREMSRKDKSLQPFLKAIEKKMPRFYPKPPRELLRGVFELLNEFVSSGELKDVKSCFSQEVRDFWPTATPKKKKAA